MNAVRVYLDYAASTPLHEEVLEAMVPYLRSAGNPSSIHAAGRALRAAIEEARQKIADLIGAAPGEIVFTSGGTEADNHAIRGAIETLGIKTIVYNPTEHHAVLHTIEDLVSRGQVKAVVVPVDTMGRIILDALEQLLRQHPKALVSIMYVNNEIGTLQPVQEIAELCKQYGAYYHSDTVQVMGLGWVDVREWPVDFLAASAHKFYGPKGIGFLYRRVPLKSFITGGAQERGQRAGTENVAAIVGMACALQKAYAQKQAYNEHLWTLKQHLLRLLHESIPGVILHGDPSREGSHPGILNFHLPQADDLLLIRLDMAGICVSGTSACSSGSGHPSHVLQAIGLSSEDAMRSLRLSWGRETTAANLTYTVEQIAESIVASSPEA